MTQISFWTAFLLELLTLFLRAFSDGTVIVLKEPARLFSPQQQGSQVIRNLKALPHLEMQGPDFQVRKLLTEWLACCGLLVWHILYL